MPGIPLLDVLQETSRLLKNCVDDTDDDDNCGDGDGGDDGDLFAPGHQEGSSASRPSPPRPRPSASRLCDCDHKQVFGNTREVLRKYLSGKFLVKGIRVGMGGQ